MEKIHPFAIQQIEGNRTVPILETSSSESLTLASVIQFFAFKRSYFVELDKSDRVRAT